MLKTRREKIEEILKMDVVTSVYCQLIVARSEKRKQLPIKKSRGTSDFLLCYSNADSTVQDRRTLVCDMTTSLIPDRAR